MYRTFMVVILVLSVVTISYAQESFNRLCMDRSQQPFMIPDCKNYDYQRFIEDKVNRTENSLNRILNSMEDFLEEIGDRLRLSFWEHDFRNAQNGYRGYVGKMIEFKADFIKKTHEGNSSERKCMLNEYKLKLLSPYLSHLEGEMRSFCQFYSQKFMRPQ